MGVLDILRLVSRILIFPFANIATADRPDLLLWMDRLSPVLAPLPLIGALCGTYSDLRILPLPEQPPEDALEAAKEAALDYIERRPRTEKEVRDKLREKGVSAEAAEGAVAFLLEYGFLNDEAFAARFAEDAIRKGRGPLRIERDLALKGIPREAAKRALAPYKTARGNDGPYDGETTDERDTTERTEYRDDDTPTFRETAEALARKTYEGAGSPPDIDDKLAAKILRKLASRGFTASDGYAALEEVRRLVREAC